MNTMIVRYFFFVGICSLSQQLSANTATAGYSSMPAVDCVINPYRVVDISSPVAGVIETLYVERSQRVSAGQVVAQLEASVERANVELARYRASVQSEIGLGKVNINFDQMRKKRVEGLLEEQNISLENADQIEREVQLSKWKLKQAKELADIRRLELRKAEEQLRQKSIPAPFDGFVLDTFKYRGEYVEDQAILRLAQLDPLVVEAIVPMENFGKIKPGMHAEIRPEVLFKDKLLSTVVAVDRIGDTASNTFGVKLSIPNPENRIPAGLKCIVKFLELTPEQVAEEEVPEEEVPEVPVAEQQVSGKQIAAEQLPEQQAAAESLDETGNETPNGLIERSAEATEPKASAVKLSSTTIAGPSELLAAISAANAADALATGPVKADDPSPIELHRQVASLAILDELESPVSSVKTPTSYMVLIEQAETRAATRDLVARLRDAGVSDFLVFNNGANKGHISLGVYSKHAYAVNRQQRLDQLGFTSFTVERY